ncbi:molybdenum cofactor guanylyltransferase [Shewanella sp. NFH-SH190041]|uniref:molybdenum cofactor guanylyltransferase MobA n=1 Tax=Shewanella sp. NFH-SH190041 TaxID=2950245 RepID=UPI0021C49CE8|nr:molybdenum cofactor guanylyltransferase MobA [Shewanella sp. NFH-SH190041]BDM62787.1 molybdenum cofactor guanylyltransferase [Shewanella sp. NFH-SH190041]
MSSQIEAVILAGGRARRMGGEDKGLVELNGRPMISYTLDRLTPQVTSMVINANRSQETYRQFGLPVFCDDQSGFLGPLAGIVSALKRTHADYLLTVPCDSPLLPTDLAARMLTALEQTSAELAVASNGEREQPVIMLLKPTLADSIQAFLDAGERKIDFWYAKHQVAVVSFADQPMAFVNVNTQEQKQQLADTLSR